MNTPEKNRLRLYFERTTEPQEGKGCGYIKRQWQRWGERDDASIRTAVAGKRIPSGN